eukprot:jgi/Tetstr1/447559/TSEL_034938.t1
MLARMYAGLQEELRVLTYNPITINTSTQRRMRRRGAQTATSTAEDADEAGCEKGRQEGGQEVAVLVEIANRRKFDARPMNLVVMENITDNLDPYREEGVLGDWENKYHVTYARYRYDVKYLDGLPEDHTEVDELDVTIVRWTARQCKHDFRGTKLTAVTSMKGASEIKDSRHSNFVVRRPLARLRNTMQLQEEANRESGASLPLDGIGHMEITHELARHRAVLNIHKHDVTNQRRWLNDHRFNADENKCVLDMLTL